MSPRHECKCYHVLLVTGKELGAVRLVEGRGDPDGAWEYGRLEVIVNGFWTVLKSPGASSLTLGRGGSQVACRMLGFSAGAQMMVGLSSPFPAPSSALQFITGVTCEGSEQQLSDCDVQISDVNYAFDAAGHMSRPPYTYDYDFDYDGYADGTILDVLPGAVSLICTSPSGMTLDLCFTCPPLQDT